MALSGEPANGLFELGFLARKYNKANTIAARAVTPQAMPMPAFAPVEIPEDCLDCTGGFKASNPGEVAAGPVEVSNELLPVDAELDDEVVVAGKFQPFI